MNINFFTDLLINETNIVVLDKWSIYLKLNNINETITLCLPFVLFMNNIPKNIFSLRDKYFAKKLYDECFGNKNIFFCTMKNFDGGYRKKEFVESSEEVTRLLKQSIQVVFGTTTPKIITVYDINNFYNFTSPNVVISHGVYVKRGYDEISFGYETVVNGNIVDGLSIYNISKNFIVYFNINKSIFWVLLFFFTLNGFLDIGNLSQELLGIVITELELKKFFNSTFNYTFSSKQGIVVLSTCFKKQTTIDILNNLFYVDFNINDVIMNEDEEENEKRKMENMEKMEKMENMENMENMEKKKNGDVVYKTLDIYGHKLQVKKLPVETGNDFLFNYISKLRPEELERFPKELIFYLYQKYNMLDYLPNCEILCSISDKFNSLHPNTQMLIIDKNILMIVDDRFYNKKRFESELKEIIQERFLFFFFYNLYYSFSEDILHLRQLIIYNYKEKFENFLSIKLDEDDSIYLKKSLSSFLHS